jgi:tetratricopeptide (TPR) repeat protein
MIYFKNFTSMLILVSILFAGQDLESAKIRIKDKDWNEAETYLLKALDHPKDKWEAAFHLGDKIYPRKQDWESVKKYMDIAATAPSNLKIRPTRNDRKISINQAIVASRTKSYNLLYYKATGFLGLLNKATTEEQRISLIEQAIKTSLDAKNLDPSQPGSYALAALYSSVKGDKKNTIKYLDMGLALDDIPEETKIALLVSAGQSVVRLGDFDKGLSYYEKAININPNEPTALKSIGALYLAQDDYDSALINLNKALENTEDDKEKVDLFFNRGLVYLKMENYEEAEYNFEEAYFLSPDDIEALLGLAKALEQAERWRKARNYYMELIDKNPNDSQYYYGVYRTYFGEGRLEDAQEYLNKATALKKQN